MRRLLPLLLLVLSVLPLRAQAPACTGLCLQQVSCSGGGTTSISGTVYAPNGTDPLPNVLVFIPNATPDPFTPGVQCPVPGAPPSGSPLVGSTTGADGTFKLVNVPVGTNIPIVFQAGRWRRQLVVATTTQCADTAFSGNMPKNQTEGDIPLIAVATGSVDSVECVLRKVGIQDAEFTNPMSTGRIHLYSGTFSPGALVDANTPSQSALMNDPAQLAKYDVVMLPCQGGSTGQTSNASLANLLNYTNAGGRLYASHFSYTWFYQNGPFSTVANWLGSSSTLPDGPATVNTSFASGKTLSDWLQVVGASTTPGQINVQTVKKDINGVNSPTQIWLTLNGSGNPVEQFTWNAPVNSTNQCGRVLFNEYHVEASTPATSSGKAFPAECSNTAMTNQEKLLEYSLFDLTNSGGQPTLTPASQDFGSVAVGFSSSPQTFTWTNNSIFAAAISSATASGDFAVTGNTCQNVQPGASCQVTVVYKPTQIGAGSGTLTVVSNAATLTSNLTGTGTAPLSVSTTALGFPNTDVGATVSQSFQITNVAPGAVPLTAPAITGDYAATSNCGSSLAAASTCTVTVSFTPSATGSRPGTLTMGGANVTLTGTGVDFSVALNPSSGSLVAGKSLTTPAALLPLSGFSSVVTVSCTTTTPGSTCTPAKLSLVPSDTAGETITITSTAEYAIVGYQGMGRGILLMLGGLGSLAMVLARRRMRLGVALAGIILLMGACSLMTGCSGKLPSQNANYTPAGSYTYTLTATDGFLTHSATFSLTVTAK